MGAFLVPRMGVRGSRFPGREFGGSRFSAEVGEMKGD